MIAAENELSKAISTLDGVAVQLREYVTAAAKDGVRQYDVEGQIKARVLELGKAAMDLYLRLQGDGDCGETVATATGKVLQRSDQPVRRVLRTIFGHHEFAQFIYTAGVHRKVELRPLDARLQLPEGRYSYLYEELSQLFVIDGAFGAAKTRWEAVFGQAPPVDSLERINRRVGGQAGAFLDALPTPLREEEGELLVASADGKGVPLVQADVEKVPVFEKRERPGNRRMATLGAIYSVDRHVRTAEQIVEGLFREPSAEPPPDRPKPRGKHLIGCFSYFEDDGGKPVPISGGYVAFAWLREQIDKRRRPGQIVIRLLDGQPSLLEAGEACLSDLDDVQVIDVLDVIHVSSYVWSAAKVLETTAEHREAFVWDRLQRILEGQVQGVIAGLRQMATKRGLREAERRQIDAICGYFENNAHRMRYDEYLAAGYPIATGVIEGACRHLVKDRMERSGMRWTLDGAQAMLNLRAVEASSYWNDFHQTRMTSEIARLHATAHSLNNQKPQSMCL